MNNYKIRSASIKDIKDIYNLYQIASMTVGGIARNVLIFKI